MNDKTRPVSNDASALIDGFLAANPLPTLAQWKDLTYSHPEYVVQIVDTMVMLSALPTEGESEEGVDVELFNATRSAMLSIVHTNSDASDAVRLALKRCRGAAARDFARQIGLGERVDLFNQIVSGEVSAPYTLLKRLAAKLQVHFVALAEVFSLNFQHQQAQSFKADGKPILSEQPARWEQAVRAAGITGEEANRLLLLEKEMD